MKSSLEWLFLLVLVNPVVSCSEKRALDTIYIPEAFSDGRSLVSIYEIIPLQTGSDLIGEVSKLIYSREYCFIADKTHQAVHCLTHDGRSVYAIKSAGYGPEEYISLKDIAVNEALGTLEVLDVMGQKVQRYDLATGFFKDTQKFSYYTESFISTGQIRLFHNAVLPNHEYLGIDSLGASVFYTDAGNNIIKTGFGFDSTYLNKVRLITDYNFYQKGDFGYLFVPLFSPVVYELKNKGLVPEYYLDFGVRAIPEDYLKEYKGHWRDFPVQLSSTNYVHSVADFYENRSHIIFKGFFGLTPFYVVHDKSSGNNLLLKDAPQTPMGLPLHPVAAFQDRLVCVVPFETLEQRLKLIEQSMTRDQLSQLEEYTRLKEIVTGGNNQNPVLVMVSFDSISVGL